jgi:Ca2+-binding RTX toxin-like protein
VANGVDVLSDIATRLAAVITGSGSGDWVASAQGRVLSLVNRVGNTLPVTPTWQVRAAGQVSVSNGSSNNSVVANSASLIVSGTVIAGETWVLQLRVGNPATGVPAVVTVGYTARSGDDLAHVALGLKAALQALRDTAALAVQAVANGNSLQLSSSSLFLASASVQPDGSVTGDVQNAAARVFTLSGTPVTGERWSVTLDGVAYAVTVDSSHATLDTLGAALQAAINAASTQDLRTFYVAGSLYVSQPVGATFAASARVDLLTPVRGAVSAPVLDTATGKQTITLSGTSVVGETWLVKLTLNEVTRSYAVTVALDGAQVPQTLAALAAALKDAINADAGNGYIATAVGNALVVETNVINPKTSLLFTFTVQASVAPVVRPAGAAEVVRGVDASGAERVTVLEVLQGGGVPVTGAHWTLQLTLGSVVMRFDYGVHNGESKQAVAQAFADLINSAVLLPGSSLSGLLAGADTDGTLVLADIGGRSLKASLSLVPVAQAAINNGAATTTLVNLVGTPAANEIWRLRLDALPPLEVKLGDTVNGHVLANLADFATALAWLVNASADAANFSALADGTRIIIVNRLGKVFDTRLESGTITRREGFADVTLDYALKDTELQQQLSKLYGFDGIAVTEVRTKTDVNYRIEFVREQAGINQQPLHWTESALTSSLLPSPDASVDVSTVTVRDGATVNAGLNNLQTISINPNVTSGSFTLWFRLVNARGEFSLVESDPIAFDATALDLYKALSKILNPNGSTIDIDPAYDAAWRVPSKPFTDNVAVRKIGNVFQITFQGAYRDLAIYDMDTRGLTTEVLGTTPAHEALVTTVTLGGTLGVMTVPGHTPRATTVDLTQQLPVTGAVWSVQISLRGVTSVHDVVVGDSYLVGGITVLADTALHLAEILAASINATAPELFTASNDGAVLVIVERNGAAFATRMQVGASSLGVQDIDRFSPNVAALALTGQAAAGEVWSVTLSDGATTPTLLQVLVTATDALEDIARGLADKINTLADANFAAMVEGNGLIIVRRDGRLFAATAHIAAAGQPKQGEVWSVTLQSATSSVTTAAAHGGALAISYTVGANETHASVSRALADLINTLGRPEFHATSTGAVLSIENIAGNVFTTTFAVDSVDRSEAIEVASAILTTRVDGINYYELEVLNLQTGSGDDVLNVQGTSADTTVALNAGNDHIYVSSTASYGIAGSAHVGPTDFLTGHLHNINGALNLDAGIGRNLLLISGEASTLDNSDIVISDILVAAEPTNAEIAVRGLTGGTAAFGWADLAQGTITYRADSSGNFADGMRLWTGFGADTIHIDGTLYRTGERSITLLSTGLGDDTVYINLQTTEANGSDTSDGLLVLNTQGPWNDYAHISDNDTVIATGKDPIFGGAFADFSTSVPLVVLGGQGSDMITGGSGNDILFGDRGRVLSYGFVNGATVASVVEQLGSGGAGDLIDGVVRNPDQILSVDLTIGGDDTLIGMEGDNILIGGFGNDNLSTGSGRDTLIGDHGQIDFWAGSAQIHTVQSTDTVPQTGGHDTIVTGDGHNFVVAGMGADQVNDPAAVFSLGMVAGSGSDTVLGDNGFYTLDSNGRLMVIESTLPNLGGDDMLLTGNANSIVIGGFGNDSITTGAGADIVLGDDGRIDTMLDGNPADIDLITSTSTTAFGGADNINSGAGNDIVIGGRMDDSVNAGEGDNIVVGDSGAVTAATVDAPQRAGLPMTVGVIESMTFADGGRDTITTGDGNNIVIGGFGNDTITTGAGADIVLGDDGRIDTMLDGNPADIDLITSTSTTAFGGADTINSGGGNDIVIGGRMDDTINAGEGANIVIGDSGTITAATADAPQRDGLPITIGVIETTTYAEGGRDTITAGDGGNIVFGGFGDDNITTGAGADFVLGDDGRIDTMLDGNPADIDLITSTSTTELGGSDAISSGGGNDIVIGGRMDDTVNAGEGDNIVIGDSGAITAATVDAPQLAGLPITIATVESISIADGGNDTITSGSGSDVVIAGFGSDIVDSGDGNDVVLGDNGVIQVYASGAIAQVTTGDPALGGNDLLITGGGNDVAMGGAGNDTLLGGAGNDILFGDSGQVSYSPDGSLVYILSLDTTIGGNDILDAGTGNDVLIGGQGLDRLYGSLSSDLLFGTNAAVRLFNGLVVTMEADLHDLATSTLFGMFDALPDRLEIALFLSQDSWMRGDREGDTQAATLQGEDLLDTAVFQRLFALGTHGSRNGMAGADVFQNLFQLGNLSLPADQAHSWSLEPQDGDAAPTPVPASDAVPATSEQPEVSQQPMASAAPLADAHGHLRDDVLATMLGFAGLHLQNGRRIRCRTLLRVASRKWRAAMRRRSI